MGMIRALSTSIAFLVMGAGWCQALAADAPEGDEIERAEREPILCGARSISCFFNSTNFLISLSKPRFCQMHFLLRSFRKRFSADVHGQKICLWFG